MMSVTFPLARPRLRVLRPRSRRGFSLVEVLVVVAILGITIMLAFQGASSMLKRQKLASASNDLRAFVQRAQIETQRRNTVAFLLVHPWSAQGTPVDIILDRNANGLPDDAALATYTLPPELALSSTSATGQEGFGNCSGLVCWVTPGDGTHYLECDFQGRAFNPVTAQQIGAPATVLLTHSNMIDGSLQPKVVYTLSINPVWSASLSQKVGP